MRNLAKQEICKARDTGRVEGRGIHGHWTLQILPIRHGRTTDERSRPFVWDSSGEEGIWLPGLNVFVAVMTKPGSLPTFGLAE